MHPDVEIDTLFYKQLIHTKDSAEENNLDWLKESTEFCKYKQKNIKKDLDEYVQVAEEE